MTGPLAALAEVLPEGGASDAEADRLAVSTDLWPRHLIRMAAGERPTLPLGVVWPESVPDLQQIVRVARREGLALVAYGAGSSVVGGATPRARQVVVDLKRMARLIEIDAGGRTATAQVGILGELLERQLERRGFTQGHFPSSIYCSTLGGWIAARSAGQMSSRYGKIEDQILGGRIVLGDGSLLTQRPSPVRDPLFDTLVGAEGTMGLWGEAVVRIHPLPERRLWRGFTFPDVERAVTAARLWVEAGLTLCVLRLYDPLDTFLHRVAHAEQKAQDRGPNRMARIGTLLPRLTAWIGDRFSGGCRCVVGLQGSARSADLQLGELLGIAEQHSAKDLGPGPGQAWYARRYAISYGQSRAFRAGVAVDTMEVACPWDRIVPVYRSVREAALSSGAQTLAHFSHVYLEGGSIYFTYAVPISKGTKGYDRLWENALQAALQAGANVSHHHGTGRLKAAALSETLGGADLVVQDLHQRLDPDRILNPDILTGDQTLSGASDKPARWRAFRAPGLVRAPATERLADLEAQVEAEGRTLGAIAALMPHATVLEAARRRLLWHANTQIKVIESLVAGVDASVEGRPHWFVPAPRAAMGPDVTSGLLEADVDAIWLRTSPRLGVHVRATGDLGWALGSVRHAAGDEACYSARLALAGHGTACSIDAWLPDGERGDEIAGALLRRLGRSPPLVDATGEVFTPLEDEPLFFAGPWRGVVALLGAAADAGLAFVVPWVDAVGAAGFVVSGERTLDEEAAARMRALAGELGLTGEAVRGAPSIEAGRATTKREAPSGAAPEALPGETFAGPFDLPGHGGALDNCTYCPKLCRFACPVAVADGSETVTPRQLMLTASLHRQGLRSLSADVAGRLWACVDCRGCRTFCDHGNDVASALIDARAMLLDVAPPAVRAYLDAFVRLGRPPDVAPADSLVRDLRVDGSGARTALLLGCQVRDDLLQARAALALTERRFGATHLLDGSVDCCGHPLWRWGDREAFASHARGLAQHAGDAERIVVTDAGCALAFESLYPRVGVELPPVFTVASLLRDEAWQLRSRERWAIHDNCFAVRWLDEPSLAEHPALRGADVVAGSVLEGEAGCCGGMLLDAYDRRVAERVARSAAHDLVGGGATRILTSSPTCRRRLVAVGAPVADLVTLWFQARQ